jgi:hypothetical protein
LTYALRGKPMVRLLLMYLIANSWNEPKIFAKK